MEDDFVSFSDNKGLYFPTNSDTSLCTNSNHQRHCLEASGLMANTTTPRLLISSIWSQAIGHTAFNHTDCLFVCFVFNLMLDVALGWKLGFIFLLGSLDSLA